MVETGENRAEKLLGLHAREQELEELEIKDKALTAKLEELKQESQIGE